MCPEMPRQMVVFSVTIEELELEINFTQYGNKVVGRDLPLRCTV